MSAEIKKVLIERDSMTAYEADCLIDDARNAIKNGEDPEAVLAEFFGLEPDYIYGLIL